MVRTAAPGLARASKATCCMQLVPFQLGDARANIPTIPFPPSHQHLPQPRPVHWPPVSKEGLNELLLRDAVALKLHLRQRGRVTVSIHAHACMGIGPLVQPWAPSSGAAEPHTQYQSITKHRAPLPKDGNKGALGLLTQAEGCLAFSRSWKLMLKKRGISLKNGS